MPSQLSLNSEALTSWPAERVFDASWAATTVQRALRRLCEECERKGRRRVFEVLSPYLSAERDDLSYATLAMKLDVPESFVKRLLHRMRQRFRMFLREEVHQTVADPADVDEELRHLCGSLAASYA
jgi:RNA polymerase sigma-70 factor (ECF subfamily)